MIKVLLYIYKSSFNLHFVVLKTKINESWLDDLLTELANCNSLILISC